MKRLSTLIILLITTLSLTACGSLGYGKTVAIEDPSTLSTMNQTISSAVEYYFDVAIQENQTFNYEAFESHIPDANGSKEHIHQSNIFQAMVTGDAVEGEISSYGGVLTPDNTSITGLILNIFNEKVGPTVYTQEELETIAINFLSSKKLITADEKVTFTDINEKASSTYITVLNFNTETTRFAVGVNLQFGNVVYFEHAPVEFFE